MNRHLNDEQWNALAREHGFTDMRALLHELYTREERTTKEVGDIIGTGKDRVAQLLRKHNIPLRKKGGIRL